MEQTSHQQPVFDAASDDDTQPDLYRYDRIAERVASFAAVTDEHLAFYREHGYLAVINAFSPAEVQAALSGLIDLIDGANPDFTGVQFEAWARNRLHTIGRDAKQDCVRKLMYFADHDQRLKALADHPDLLAMLRRLLGDEPHMFQDMALLKPPSGGREKPWHQDKAFFNLRIGSPVVGVWIALDPATAENGCMHIIPGSHREGPVVHWKRRDWQICDTDVQTARDVMVPLPPGGCLFFDGLLQHGTPANRSSHRRRAVQFHYTTPSAVWTDEGERLAVFGSEGKNVSC